MKPYHQIHQLKGHPAVPLADYLQSFKHKNTKFHIERLLDLLYQILRTANFWDFLFWDTLKLWIRGMLLSLIKSLHLLSICWTGGDSGYWRNCGELCKENAKPPIQHRAAQHWKTHIGSNMRSRLWRHCCCSFLNFSTSKHANDFREAVKKNCFFMNNS